MTKPLALEPHADAPAEELRVDLLAHEVDPRDREQLGVELVAEDHGALVALDAGERAAAQRPVDVDVAAGRDLGPVADRGGDHEVAVRHDDLLAAAHRLGHDRGRAAAGCRRRLDRHWRARLLGDFRLPGRPLRGRGRSGAHHGEARLLRRLDPGRPAVLDADRVQPLRPQPLGEVLEVEGRLLGDRADVQHDRGGAEEVRRVRDLVEQQREEVRVPGLQEAQRQDRLHRAADLERETEPAGRGRRLVRWALHLVL